MVKKIIFFLIIYSSFSFGALQYLIRTTESATAFDSIAGATSWAAADDDSIQVSIGFSFPFNNTTYNNVWLNSNGMLTFNGIYRRYGNTALSNTSADEYGNPATNAAQSIYPYWDDLDRSRVKQGKITYRTLGTAGIDLRFVITWTAVRYYSGNGYNTFQVILYETGQIRFRYLSNGANNNDTTGRGATIGVQENTTNFDQYSFNSAIPQDPTVDVVYYPKPILAISKSSCVIHDPINNITNPKRIPGSTIRYAVQVSNTGIGAASNVLATDSLNTNFLTSSIKNLQIQPGLCNCSGVTGTSNNGPSGSANGVNPVILDYGSVAKGTPASPTRECGYFEVDIK